MILCKNTMKNQNKQKTEDLGGDSMYFVLYLVFKDIVIHDVAFSDISDLCACYRQAEMMIYIQSMGIIFIAGEPDFHEPPLTA